MDDIRFYEEDIKRRLAEGFPVVPGETDVQNILNLNLPSEDGKEVVCTCTIQSEGGQGSLVDNLLGIIARSTRVENGAFNKMVTVICPIKHDGNVSRPCIPDVFKTLSTINSDSIESAFSGFNFIESNNNVDTFVILRGKAFSAPCSPNIILIDARSLQNPPVAYYNRGIVEQYPIRKLMDENDGKNLIVIIGDRIFSPQLTFTTNNFPGLRRLAYVKGENSFFEVSPLHDPCTGYTSSLNHSDIRSEASENPVNMIRTLVKLNPHDRKGYDPDRLCTVVINARGETEGLKLPNDDFTNRLASIIRKIVRVYDCGTFTLDINMLCKIDEESYAVDAAMKEDKMNGNLIERCILMKILRGKHQSEDGSRLMELTVTSDKKIAQESLKYIADFIMGYIVLTKRVGQNDK